MGSRPELVRVRDTVIKHFHDRAGLEDVERVVLESGRTMKADGMTLEEILVVAKGAVTLAAEHVNNPRIPEWATLIRAQMAPWLISMYLAGAADLEEDEATG